MKTIDVSKIPLKTSPITANRTKMSKDDVNYPDRMKNSSEIQWARWQWMNDNPIDYVNLMRQQGYLDEDIQHMLSRKKPLDFDSIEDFEQFKSEVRELQGQLTADYQLKNLRFIQQGSSITGFSTNPRKGDRDIPNYIFNKAEGSDLDFRIHADNIESIYDPNKGIELKTQPGLEIRLIEPSSAGVVVPELITFADVWKTKIKQDMQFTLVLDYNKEFEPKHWDWEYGN